MIDYRLLGPIEADVNGHTLDIGGLKQRALLAILLLRANEPVPRDVLVDQLWGEHPPAGAQHTLEVYISRLRKTLEPPAGCEVVVTRPGGYLLRAAAEQLDVGRFERLAGEGGGARCSRQSTQSSTAAPTCFSLLRRPAKSTTSSACFAVASYTNNGPNLTLAEQWNRTGADVLATASRPAAEGGLALACAHARFLSASAAWQRTPMPPWRWSSARAFANRISPAWLDTSAWCTSA